MTTAVEANAVTEFSFWIEIPVFIKLARIGEMAEMCGSISSSEAPSMKLVMAEQQWADTLGTGSLRVSMSTGSTIWPYSSWNSSVISSLIWPMQWSAANLTLALGCFKWVSTIGTMAEMFLMSSMYSPTWEKAIKAAFLNLQSESLLMVVSTMELKIGRHFCSPTAEIILSMQLFPKLTLSSPSSACPLSLNPSFGFIHSSSILSSISIMSLKISSINCLRSSSSFLTMDGTLSITVT